MLRKNPSVYEAVWSIPVTLLTSGWQTSLTNIGIDTMLLPEAWPVRNLPSRRTEIFGARTIDNSPSIIKIQSTIMLN